MGTVEEDDTNVCLMLRQHSSGKKTRESKGTSRGINWHKIGIYFFESSAQFHKLKQSDKICASTFINLPEVCVFLPGTKRLRAGTYLVICATYEPKLLAKISFTALSEKEWRRKQREKAKLAAKKRKQQQPASASKELNRL